jgi:hypothetical protein
MVFVGLEIEAPFELFGFLGVIRQARLNSGAADAAPDPTGRGASVNTVACAAT